STFADDLSNRLARATMRVIAVVKGSPGDARAALENASREGSVDVIACTPVAATWTVFEGLAKQSPNLATTKLAVVSPYRWPNFLKRENLLNIVNQISVIAIVAVGMTLVIITGGIDLSVGSLIAFSAVVTASLIRDHGGVNASTATL